MQANGIAITFAAPRAEHARYTPVLAAFAEAHPTITVNLIASDASGAPAPDLPALLRQADVADVTDLAVDASLRGALVDLAPLIAADPQFAPADFVPAAGRLDGSAPVFGVPHTLSVSLLAYHVPRWARVSPTLAPDAVLRTRADLLTAADALAQRDGATVTTYGLYDPDGRRALATNLAALTPPLAVDAATLARLDTPELAAVLQDVADRAATGALLVEPSVAAARERIRAGQVGLWPLNRDLPAPGATDVPFAVGVVPLPGPGSVQPAGGYVMSAGTAQRAAAWQLISFLSRTTPPPPAAALPSGFVPTRATLAKSADYWAGLDPAVATALHTSLARPEAGLPLVDARVLGRLAEAQAQVLRDDVAPEAALRQAVVALTEDLEATSQAAQASTAPPVVAPVTTPTRSGATTLRFLATYGQADQPRWEALIATFEAQHPDISIDLVNAFEHARNLPGRGATNEEYLQRIDCFYSNLRGRLMIIQSPELLLDLAPLRDADAGFDPTAIPEAFWSQYRVESRQYAMPFEVLFRVLKYNPALFDAAGLAYPDASWTYDDLLHAAQRLTDGDVMPPQYGFAAPDVRQIPFFLTMFEAQPFRRVDGLLQPNFTDPGVQAAAQSYAQLLSTYSPHQALPSLSEAGEPFAFEAVFDGRVGMWLELGETSREGGYARPRDARGRPVTGPEAIAPLPLVAYDLSDVDVRTSGLFLTRTTPHPEACWQWLTFLSGAAEAVGAGYYPANLRVAESDAYQASLSADARAILQVYLPALEAAPAQSERNLLRGFPDITPYWLYVAFDQVLRGAPVEASLAEAQRITEAHVACVRAGGEATACATQVDPTFERWTGRQVYVHSPSD